VGSWEHFEHGADVGLRGVGATPEEAFAQAGHALFALVADDPTRVGSGVEKPLACEARGIEELLVAFLNELIYLLGAERLVLGRFELSIAQSAPELWRLSGRTWGEPYDAERHESTVEPKGATYTALRVAERDGRWVAQCVVDV
jgi:SHS2 domain-containing protein